MYLISLKYQKPCFKKKTTDVIAIKEKKIT